MTTRDILSKLESELEAGIATEVQVVYLLAGIRKLVERDERDDEYGVLEFHCDWALHSHLDRSAARAILEQFEAAHVLLQDQIELDGLPRDLRIEIDRISKMESFEEELSTFLAEYGLPPLTQHRSDGWAHFLHLYAKVIEDIPLVVSRKKREGTFGVRDSRPNVSRLTVHCEMAREHLKHSDGEDVLFKVRWIIEDRNGRTGEFFVINSFELRGPSA
jgi:hypothetical protein